jgi:hypothetical protein
MRLLIDLIRGFFPEQVPIWVKALFCFAMVFGGLSTFFAYRIMSDTNKHKPIAERDSYFLWYPQKALRVFNEYEQRFPKGRKPFWFKICLMAGALTFMAWFFLSLWYAQWICSLTSRNTSFAAYSRCHLYTAVLHPSGGQTGRFPGIFVCRGSPAQRDRLVAVDVAHHVTQRGNARQFILASDAERMVYLDLR